jgi:hypothetical protein
VLGRSGRGVTEQQNVDVSEVDFLIGSLAGPLCAGGGFCAGSDEIVEHQRISASAYTYSAALPAMLATTASESLGLLQSTPDILIQLRENTKAMRAQLDPRSDWVICTSAAENPIMLLTLKPEVVASRGLSDEEQDRLLQDIVDEASSRLSPGIRPALRVWANWTIDASKRSADHPSEADASSSSRDPEGGWLAVATGPEGLHHHGTIAEGNREGRHHNQTCDHQSDD